jgi:hypothetical protein
VLQFLNPAGLFALAGVLVPVLIHLWNKKQQKTIKVGSIRWLQPSESRKLSSIRLNEIPLLLLRSAIIALLALVIVQPQWQSGTSPAPRKEVFVSPELLNQQSLNSLSPAIDSLLTAGYQLKQLDPTFSSIDAQEWKSYKEAGIAQATGKDNYWNLLEMQQEGLTSADTLWFFTGNRIQNYQGTKPLAGGNIFWFPVATGSEEQWVQQVWLSGKDSLMLLLGQSNSEGTRFIRKQASLADASESIKIEGFPDARLIFEDKTPVKLTTGTDTIQITQPIKKILLYYDSSRLEDSRYLTAALRAATEFMGFDTRVEVAQDSIQAEGAEWLFWLSDKSLPSNINALVQQGMNLVHDAPVPAISIKNNLLLIDKQAEVALWKVVPGEEAGLALLQDSYGNTVLSKETAGHGAVYNFRSRFSPEWSQLPESEAFPEFVVKLLSEDAVSTLMDLRGLDDVQVIPAKDSRPENIDKNKIVAIDVRPWVVLLAMFLFALERLWVHQKKLI